MVGRGGLSSDRPYLRGFETTRFLSDETFRNGEQAVLAMDVIALVDALEIESAIVAGFDWGARMADIVAALWPERCTGLVSVSGYLIVNLEANRKPLPPKAELGWWYQYYFSTERGRLGYGQNRREFNKLVWQIASPEWGFDDGTFERTAASFANPDHVDIVIHQLPLAAEPCGRIARRGSPASGDRLAQLAPARAGGFAGKRSRYQHPATAATPDAGVGQP
jgi:pimeloyl-ACP methyl ester carboxylesterase